PKLPQLGDVLPCPCPLYSNTSEVDRSPRRPNIASHPARDVAGWMVVETSGPEIVTRPRGALPPRRSRSASPRSTRRNGMIVSRLVLRKPTIKGTWNRVWWDRQTGIPGGLRGLTREPTREELETWALQIGFDPVRYITAWVCQAEEVRCPTSLEPPAGPP